MSHRVFALFVCVAVLVSAGCAAAPQKLPAKAPGRYVEHYRVGGFERSYILRVPPAYDGTKPLPLVIILHGWTANAAVAETGSHMDRESDTNGFVMVAPEGLGNPQGWNAGFFNLSGKQVDDVQFIQSLMDRVEGEVGIDPDRVYVAGHSNGAFLSHLLASRLSSRIAAFAAVAGTIGIPGKDGSVKVIPEPMGPVSALLIHGEADRMVSYAPGSPALLHGVGAMDSAKWWAQRDGCRPTPVETKSLNGNVITDTFSGGRNGTEVTLVSIVNGVHDWPGGVNRGVPEITTGVNAADLIWAFFVAHPKRH